MPPMKGKDGGHLDVARGVRAMSAGSLGWVDAIQKIQVFFRRKEAGCFFPPPLRRYQRLRMPSSALHRMVFRAQRPGPRAL